MFLILIFKRLGNAISLNSESFYSELFFLFFFLFRIKLKKSLKFLLSNLENEFLKQKVGEERRIAIINILKEICNYFKHINIFHCIKC